MKPAEFCDLETGEVHKLVFDPFVKRWRVVPVWQRLAAPGVFVEDAV